MRITFLGAAGEVTGSCYLLETRNFRFLVDCGMFQGAEDAQKKNRAAFPFDPRSLDFVLLTHAHIDHSGLLPKLVAEGFGGPIYATTATIDLLSVMLPDSAHIQEKEAEWALEPSPLYTLQEAEESLTRFVPVDYDTMLELDRGIKCRFRNAGHILGSACIELWCEGKKLVFSGDLGQPGYHVVRAPSFVESADILIIESTYGDRLHRSLNETVKELVHAIEDTLKRKQGNVIIPSFTVGRTQDLLLLLADLHREGRLGHMNIYVDSPMAAAATGITLKHRELFGREAEKSLNWLFSHLGDPAIRFTQDVMESKALNDIRSGAVIISASGMCDAGRIKHHLKFNLPRPECTVLITGFQAAGTLGRRLVEGAKTVRIFGEEIAVNADIYTIGGLSAHADQEGILSWLAHFSKAPDETLVVHGEPESSRALSEKIREKLHWRVRIPSRGETLSV